MVSLANKKQKENNGQKLKFETHSKIFILYPDTELEPYIFDEQQVKE